MHVIELSHMLIWSDRYFWVLLCLLGKPRFHHHFFDVLIFHDIMKWLSDFAALIYVYFLVAVIPCVFQLFKFISVIYCIFPKGIITILYFLFSSFNIIIQISLDNNASNFASMARLVTFTGVEEVQKFSTC